MRHATDHRAPKASKDQPEIKELLDLMAFLVILDILDSLVMMEIRANLEQVDSLENLDPTEREYVNASFLIIVYCDLATFR